MDIRKALSEEHSKQLSLKIAAYIDGDAKRFRTLMDLVLSDDRLLAQRASWAMNKACELHPGLLLPYLEKLLEHIKGPVHDAVKRNTVSVLERLDIPEELMGTATDTCFRFLLSGEEAVAVKAYAMTVLSNLARKEPDLRHEIKLVITEMMPFGKPAIVSRGKRVLKELGYR